METSPTDSPTSSFKIDISTGEITPIVASSISLGKYSLEVFAKNETNPIVNDTSTVSQCLLTFYDNY